MLKKIQQIKAVADFDFRRFAFAHDPLRHLFPEWVDYYRGKYAICRALNPKSMLEIGVRYGYSALTFLHAAPTARYVGIDNDSDGFGGSHGALGWAREQLANYSAELILADSQQLDTLPGDYYDLVHVDGQQNGDGTFHDLELGLEKAHWLLVDGYFWSRENMLSATYFMEKYCSLIAGAYVIPGYAGDLLIETHTREDCRVFRKVVRHHVALRETYDKDYFLGDCGGYEAFKANAGRVLTDQRLRTLFDICQPSSGMRILDVGCGRGELAHACFDAGAEVIGVDYASSAIEIARMTFEPEISERLDFVHADILEYEPQGQFDAILLADVVEHLSPDALDAAFERFSSWLTPKGRLVLHTWPNRLAYERNYQKRRREAILAGSYLPKNPRTYYEDLMHINEQTPAKLRRSLKHRFSNVSIMLDDAQTVEILDAVGLRERVRTAESIFAVASASPLDRQALNSTFLQAEIPSDTATRVFIKCEHFPQKMQVDSVGQFCVTITNSSKDALASLRPFPIQLSYHWHQQGVIIEYEGLRTALHPKLGAGDIRSYRMSVKAPPSPGIYELSLTLVQEGQFWFDDIPEGAKLKMIVDIVVTVSDG